MRIWSPTGSRGRVAGPGLHNIIIIFKKILVILQQFIGRRNAAKANEQLLNAIDKSRTCWLLLIPVLSVS